MKNLIFALIICLFNVPAFGQAVWNGKTYNSRVCNNPNCGMCASIQAQLQQPRVQQSWQQVREPVQLGGGIDDGYEYLPVQQTTVQSVQVEYDVVPRQVSRQVKRCNGKQCWFETVVETVYDRIPRPRRAPIQPTVTKSVLQTTTSAAEYSTPEQVVKDIVSKLNLPITAKLFDLGCGDARFMIETSRTYGCHTIGIELEETIISKARSRIRDSGLSSLMTTFRGNVLDYDLTEADAVYMYLYSDLMEKIVPKLRKGTLVVSYQHPIPGIEAESYSTIVDGQNHVFYIGTK